MSKKRKPWHFIVEERILHYLAKYIDYDGAVQVPFDITQDGIALAIWIQRSAVPRSMKNLIKKGLAKEFKAHVKGFPRRRKVYTLTQAGLEEATVISARVDSVKVPVVMPNGEKMELGIKDIVEELNGLLSIKNECMNELKRYRQDPKFRFIDVMNYLSKDITTDYELDRMCEEIIQDIGLSWRNNSHLEKTGIVSDMARKDGHPASHEMAVPEYFVGREEEIEAITRAVYDSKVKLIYIHGMAGIGKSTLVAEVFGRRLNDIDVFYYRVHSWDSDHDFYTRLWNFLISHYSIEATPPDSPSEMARTLRELANRMLRTAIVIEDVHLSSGRLIEAIRLALDTMSSSDNVTFVVTARYRVSLTAETSLTADNVLDLPITGLRGKELREYIARLNMDDMDFDRVVEWTDGHPFVLHILRKANGEMDRMIHVERFVEEEILAKMSVGHRALLSYICVYGAPVDEDAVDFVTTKRDVKLPEDRLSELLKVEYPALLFGWNRSDIKDLAYNGLLSTEGEFYLPNHLITSIMLGRLTGYERRWYHTASAAKMYQRAIGGDTELVFHMLGHLKEARLLRALVQAYRRFERELRAVDEEKVMPILEYVIGQDRNSPILDDIERCVLYISTAQMAYELGDMAKCGTYLEMALDTYNSSGMDQKDIYALISYELGRYYTRTGNIEMARVHLEDALAIYRKHLSNMSGRNAALFRIYSALGETYWIEGNHHEASRYFSQAVEEFEKSVELPSAVKEKLKKAVDTAMGDLDRAMEMYDSILDSLRAVLDNSPFNADRVIDCYMKWILSINMMDER